VSELSLLYTTFPDEKTAETLCARLLEEKLIACANLMPKGVSFYRWEGVMKRASEVIVFMKTRTTCVDKITQLLKIHHPHTCPCLLALPIDKGMPEFLDWVRESTDVEKS
jgi:periplasmic divalent cation tolerance protein